MQPSGKPTLPDWCVILLPAALCFAVGLAVFGRRAFDELAIMAVFGTTLAGGLRSGGFDPLITRPLRRDSDPAAFWGLILVNAAMVAFAVWMLVDELQRSAS